MSMAQRWYRLDGADLARELEGLADSLDGDYSGIDENTRRCISLYENRELTGLSGSSYTAASPMIDDDCRLTYNLHRSLVDSACATITGTQRPLPMFLPSGADYVTRRKVEKLGKFFESQCRQRQGQYSDAWELAGDVFRDAVVTGAGIIKVLADSDSIRFERTPRNRVRVDLDEAAYGEPRNWIESGPIDPDIAISMFVDDDDEDSAVESARKRYAIESAKPYHDKSDGRRRVTEAVRYIEAWHVPYDDSDDSGRHVITIGGEVMLDEPWEDAAPFVVCRWSREMCGFWGVGIVDEAHPTVAIVNRQGKSLDDRQVLCGQKRTYYEEGSLDERLLEKSDAEVLIKVRTGASLPRESVVSPVSQSEVEHFESHWRKTYELTGMSQMQATGRKEQGITSGIAIRTTNDLGTQRQSVKASNYERMFVDLAQRTVEAARRVAAASPGFKLPWPGAHFHGDIKWSEVDMANDTYTVSVQPASAMPRSPEGRLQTVQEWYSAGILNPEQFMRLAQIPDLESEFGAYQADIDRVEWEVARMLDAETAEGFDFHAPDSFILDLKGAATLVAREYNAAERSGAPEHNLQLLRAYMAVLEEMIQRQQPPPQAQGAPPPQGPQMPQMMQGAPPPGMGA